jgi:hypothetical protein
MNGEQPGVVTHRGEADSVPELLKTEEDVAERAVMREELYLARAIKNNVVVYTATLAIVAIVIINLSPHLRALSGPSPTIQSCAPTLQEHREYHHLDPTLRHP